MSAPFPLPTDGNAETARALHARRALERALHHGADLMAALGLPSLVLDAIEAGIEALDALDAPDADLEDGADGEPYLAGTYNTYGSDPTGEGEPSEDDEDDGTAEPSLASPERSPTLPWGNARERYVTRDRNDTQAHWADGAQHDCEDVDEDADGLDRGEMEEGDAEPSLAAPEGCQFYNSGQRDLEQDGELDRPWWGPPADGWNHDGGRYV